MKNLYAVVEGPYTDSNPETTILFLKNGELEALRSTDRQFFGLAKARYFLERKGEERFDFVEALGNPTYYSITVGHLNKQIEDDYRRIYPISSAGQDANPKRSTKKFRDIARRASDG